MKKIIYIFFFIFLGIGVVFATSNFIKEGKNWDVNIDNSENANDIFILDGRLDLEDSRSNNYINNNYRGKITGIIKSKLFGEFNIFNLINLKFKLKNPNKSECGGVESLELYKISGIIKSDFWGKMTIDETESYFCSNQYLYIKLKSNSIGKKEIGNNGVLQGNLIDDFGKQEIAISGISKIKGNKNNGILNRGDGNIATLASSIATKSIVKKYLNKNISKLYKTYKNTSFIKSGDEGNYLDTFNNIKEENYYLYNYSNSIQNLNFENTGDYINKGKILEIGDGNINNGNDKIEINGKHTVIIKGGNIYINSNIYNKNKKSLLFIISKRINKKGGNIYINPDVTNIDAVLIADGSLLSLDGDYIQKINDSNQKKNLRKQLLIYGSVFSSNSIGTNKIPYGADYYQHIDYSNNEMDGNIYDLGNLRTFNLNYGIENTICSDTTKLVPINGEGLILENAWAGRKKCYNSDVGDNVLRKTNKKNPLIIEYNNRIQLINPFILSNN